MVNRTVVGGNQIPILRHTFQKFYISFPWGKQCDALNPIKDCQVDF